MNGHSGKMKDSRVLHGRLQIQRFRLLLRVVRNSLSRNVATKWIGRKSEVRVGIQTPGFGDAGLQATRLERGHIIIALKDDVDEKKRKKEIVVESTTAPKEEEGKGRWRRQHDVDDKKEVLQFAENLEQSPASLCLFWRRDMSRAIRSELSPLTRMAMQTCQHLSRASHQRNGGKTPAAGSHRSDGT